MSDQPLRFRFMFSGQRSTFPLSIMQRILLGLAGVVLLALLVVAARLVPDRRGYGTHQQLGVGECSVVATWGIRCPSCGMTTAWANLLDGHIRRSLAANAGGALLCAIALALVPWLLASATIGQWCYLRPNFNLIILVIATVILVTMLQWIEHTGLALLRQVQP